MDVLHKDVDINDIAKGQELVASLRPGWSSIKSKEFDSGITNKLFGYIGEDCEDKNDMILVRIYGKNTDYIIDRKRELSTHIKLNKGGFASPVYCTINNGYLYGYVDGNTLTAESVRDPNIAPIIARAIARMHCNVASSGEPVLCPTLPLWLDRVPDEFSSGKLKVLQSVVKDKASLKAEVKALNDKISSRSDLQIGFCHNDLLLENIIHNPSKQSISFIDYEYGNTNYFAFEIGNHFAEYAGIETVDFTLYPDEAYQKWWLRIYLEEVHKQKENKQTKGKEAKLGPVSDDLVDALYKQVNFFSICAHMWWGVWAIIQTLNSEIDFDFADYGRMKIGEYFKQKEKFFDYL